MRRLILSVLLLSATMPAAVAQNQPTAPNVSSPNSINSAPQDVPGRQSGSESEPPANDMPARIVGDAQYCAQASNQVLLCHYRTMASCNQAGIGGLSCVVNPTATTGAAPRP